MWNCEPDVLRDCRSIKYRIRKTGDRELLFRDVIDLWIGNPQFLDYFTELLAECPFDAFRWETPPLFSGNIDTQVFECVLLRADALDRPDDKHAFAQHFSSTIDVVAFSNLGNDAYLVVPCPTVEKPIYAHLAAFLRAAPNDQVKLLWNEVSRAMSNRISDKPVWLSTAGMGVAWLHVRLDDRPKYYGYSPYREFPQMPSH